MKAIQAHQYTFNTSAGAMLAIAAEHGLGQPARVRS